MIKIHKFANASNHLISVIRKSLEDDKTLVLLSGGSAVGIYHGLVEELGGKIPVSNLYFAQVDERYFGETQISNIQINAEKIGETGLWKVCEEMDIPYFLVSQETTFEESVKEYDQTISKLFKEYRSVIGVFGIGEDGHTAGLLPHYGKFWNINNYVAGYENKGTYTKRISLTPMAISKIRQGVVVAAGEKKKTVIGNLLNINFADNLNKFPAAILRKIKTTDLFTDQKL